MKNRVTSSTLRLCLVAAFIPAVAGVALFGQAASALDPGAGLKELTAEVRQLRMAVEEFIRTQAQTQALGMYLNAEQGRIAQMTTRLDAVRKELDGEEARFGRLTADAASLDASLSRETEPARRRQIEIQLRATKQDLDAAGVQLLQVRNREAELSQALQGEESRWTDLISKLEKVVKK